MILEIWFKKKLQSMYEYINHIQCILLGLILTTCHKELANKTNNTIIKIEFPPQE